MLSEYTLELFPGLLLQPGALEGAQRLRLVCDSWRRGKAWLPVAAFQLKIQRQFSMATTASCELGKKLGMVMVNLWVTFAW